MFGIKKVLIYVGIIKYGLKVIGVLKNNGLLILKIDGIIIVFLIVFSCKDLFKMSIIMDSDKVVLILLIEINVYIVFCVVMFDVFVLFVIVCEFFVSFVI